MKQEPGDYDKIIIVCGNHGNDYSNVMTIKEYLGPGTGVKMKKAARTKDTVFYNCPQYKSIYGSRRGVSCHNVLEVSDYLKILDEVMEHAYNDSEEVDIIGLDSSKLDKWKKKGLRFKVIGKSEDERYIVSILNKPALA